MLQEVGFVEQLNVEDVILIRRYLVLFAVLLDELVLFFAILEVLEDTGYHGNVSNLHFDLIFGVLEERHG